MNIYEKCPVIENDNLKIRLFSNDDYLDLFEVYSDKLALPFFNSDNCDGDNFYYATPDKMKEVLGFWDMAYKNCWFARLSIENKAASKVIGTIEICLRVSDDSFNNMGILRIDVASKDENESTLYEIFSLITPQIKELLGCQGILTKAPIYAIDRINAIKKVGFTPSEHMLIGKTGYTYNGYWTLMI